VKVYFFSMNSKLDKPSPSTFKTIRFISLACYGWFPKVVLFFYFLFISTEFFENYKIKGTILFDSIWVDLQSVQRYML